MKSSKRQAPITKETSSSKLQTLLFSGRLGVWRLVFFWSLVLLWNLEFGASLPALVFVIWDFFGAWTLVFGASPSYDVSF
jgi:hypothetical protein